MAVHEGFGSPQPGITQDPPFSCLAHQADADFGESFDGGAEAADTAVRANQFKHALSDAAFKEAV